MEDIEGREEVIEMRGMSELESNRLINEKEPSP